ncbi:thiosulfate dehydrogenase [quinone] large subunit [Cyclonatronum proteinivorum]|uniref:Thiosulfate dehydrogenase [quinone] large subunit n=1 Tax=Cyclonatronum proteinivorum TaxID=1457365 RepID=A0A345UNB2_9BACT|nr:MauE/DoxX family redox-associated membrane protein [Cyclonatronum proteinivorum]AXJ01964.1 thiosulfate dehydrogenase [quinone] large subunit [Cyclonatronum proteinivorum]
MSKTSHKTDKQMAFALLRLTLGINMLGRALVRLPDAQQFAEGMARNFADTILPEPFVLVYAYVILLAEAVIGVLLILGWKTRYALAGMGLLMASLTIGQILLQNYGTVANILIYAIAVYLMLTNTEHDHFGIDTGFSFKK